MLRRVGFGFLWAIPAYLVGAFGGGALVSLLSSNTHDRSVEAAMIRITVSDSRGAPWLAL